MTVFLGNINTVLLRSIDTMFSWNLIALHGGDIVTELLVVVALLALPLSDRMTVLLISGRAFLLVGGGALPRGDVFALLLRHPGADLLVHLPTLPVLDSLPGDGVLGVAFLPAAGLALLVRHHLADLVHLGLALPVGHSFAVLVIHLATGPGGDKIADSVILGGALAVELLVTLLLVEDGAFPLLLVVAFVVVHGGAVQVLALLLVDSLLELPLDRMTLLLVDSVTLPLSLVLHLRLLHIPALCRGGGGAVIVLVVRLVVRLVMRLHVQSSGTGDKEGEQNHLHLEDS